MNLQHALRRSACLTTGLLGGLLVATILLGVTEVARAAEFPEKPIDFVVPLPPGGSVDTAAREVGDRLSKNWNQPVVILNKPGASNIIGAGFVARAPKDGYTILLGVSGLTTLPSLYRHVPFDIEKDLAPISLIAKMPFLLVVPSSNPANSVQDLIAMAKAKPGQLSFGSYGSGTASHLSVVKFAKAAGIELVHIPYKGTAPALTDLMSGRLSLMISDIGPSLPFIKTGQLKALAITSAQRSPLMPNLPTVAESGLAGYEASGWFAVFAPAQTPSAVIDKYNSELASILATPDMRNRFAEFGLEPMTSTPAQLEERVRTDIERNAELVKSSGIQPDD
jgi:tripartite-type tricarboxylate transporter receptor subunit TctC